MIKEAMEFIGKLAEKTSLADAKPTIVEGVKRRDETILVLNGKLERIEDDTRPPVREHTVANLESLATLVNGPAKGNEEAGNPLRSRASVWHEDDTVVAILDDSDHKLKAVSPWIL